MNENMNDRNVMENLLLLEKGACDLYMHGAIDICRRRVRISCTERNSYLEI